MKRWLLHILCIGVFGMLAASCSQIIDDPINEGNCGLETEEVKVTFTIAMGSPESSSRADISSNDPWGNYDEENENETMGNRYFDNKIEPNKLQVLICEEDCTPIVKVEKLLYTQTETNVYTFTGSFVANMSAATKYKIMVFANCPEVSISSSWNDYLPFTMPESGNTEDLTSIPMWGVKTISGYAFTKGTNTNIGTIFVLRAMAKVEIELDEAIADEYSLTGAKFNTYNKYVNCIPKGYNGYTYEDVVVTVEKTEDLRTISTFNPNSTTSGTDLSFMTVIENQRLVAYVPEYDNDGYLKMIVNLKKGTQDGKEYDILFNDLRATTTTPFDVIRNHYYKYTITGVSTENEPSLTVSVQKWDLNQETLSFQDYVSVGTDGQIAWFEGNNTEGTPITPVKSNSGDKAYVYSNTKDGEVTCTFNISTPVGGTWYASLIGSGEDAFAFEFSDASQLGTDNVEYASHTATMATGKVGMGPITLTIKTVSDRPKLVNNEAILQIYVETYDRRTIAVKELLNKVDYSGIDMCTLIQTID